MGMTYRARTSEEGPAPSASSLFPGKFKKFFIGAGDCGQRGGGEGSSTGIERENQVDIDGLCTN